MTLLVATRDPVHKRLDRCPEMNQWLRDCAARGDELGLFDTSGESAWGDDVSRIDAERAIRLSRHQLEDVCGTNIDGLGVARSSAADRLESLLRDAGFGWLADREHLDCLHSGRRLPLPSFGHTGSQRGAWLRVPKGSEPMACTWRMRLNGSANAAKIGDEALSAQLQLASARAGGSQVLHSMLASPLAQVVESNSRPTTTRS